MAYQPAPTHDLHGSFDAAPDYSMAAPGMPGMPAFPVMHQPGMPQIVPPGGIMGLTTPQIFDALHNGIFVKQKFDMLELVTGCNREKKFYVYDHSPNSEAQKDSLVYFSCKESSGCCARNCMTSATKPLYMLIHKGFNASSANVAPVLTMQRPCTCTCWCLNRPNMTVTYTENGANEFLGKVVDEFSCCDHIYTIRDPTDKIIFTIQASCCQCGLLCKGPCQSCQRVEFKLFSGHMEKFEGMMVKLGKANILKNMLSSADNFSMSWPQITDWRHKALLLASILLINFMMFEEKDDERNRKAN